MYKRVVSIWHGRFLHKIMDDDTKKTYKQAVKITKALNSKHGYDEHTTYKLLNRFKVKYIMVETNGQGEIL